MTPSLIAPPALEPLSLVETKDWLRLDGDEEDDLVRALIVSARLSLEGFTRRFFITQHWRVAFDSWPRQTLQESPSTLSLPFAPFRSVSDIRVFDAQRAPQLLAPSAYRSAPERDAARIVFPAPPPPPGATSDGIEIDFSVGYGDRARDVPEPLRRAMSVLIAHWHENRGDSADAEALPPAALALARPFRRERLI
jgi:uncharacterized phiE125 gp8 family phage protein